ncbi:MAG: MFS transporter, partial [Clostridia bacterium]|nr:MFS transporter [Clostridia bacterium]
GWIMALARVWDAVNDPIMGNFVDRTHTKWGKCRPYLIFGPPVIMVITILAYFNSNYADATTAGGRVAIIAWAAVSYILWGMTYTVCDIPLWGLTSVITEDEGDRAKALSLARIAAGLAGIGILVVQISQAVGASFEASGLSHSEAQRKGFIVTAIGMTVISTILFEFAGLSTKERVAGSKEHYTIKENFQIMWKCRPFRQILLSGILRSPMMLLLINAMTVVTYYYANGDIMNVIGKDGVNMPILINMILVAGMMFVGQFLGMGLAPKLMQKFEKKNLYNFFTLIGALPYAGMFLLYLLSGGDVKPLAWGVPFSLFIFLAGTAMGAINVLQSVMIADCVDYEEYTNGIRTDGVFFSGQSFITKLSSGIAALISSVVFSAVGYSGANVDKLNDALHEGADFLTYDGGTGAGKYAAAMMFIISIPPAIGMMLAAIPTWRYALSDTEHTRMLNELVARRAAARAEMPEE